ncbi:MAG: YesL family protein [Lachnospiraceae bacterium]|nr:YesL family protein [Lachnospiraceae bacterium]
MNKLTGIFSPDNKFTNFLSKIMYLAWLNLLWLICSLPIITIGASTTAVYYTTLRMARDEESYIARDFFHSFKENFRQATIVWLIMLAFVLMLAVNWWAFSSSPNDLLRILSFLFLSILFIFVLIGTWFFPLLSQFHTSIMDLFRSSLFISLKNIHWSFCLAVIFWCGGALIVLKLFPLTVFGLPLLAFAQSFIFNRIFRQYLAEEEFEEGKEAVIS